MNQIKIIVRKNEEKILPYFIAETNSVHLTVKLVGEGASVNIVGIFLLGKQEEIIFNTTVIHESSYTKSKTDLRGVFFDKSSFGNDGMITIAKGAKGADGFFKSKVLLFDDAKGRSVPSLEIDENEVKAGHASTVGRTDENQLFYLRSRGLSEKQAVKLILSGFFKELIPLFHVSEQKIIEKKLNSSIDL